MVGPGSAGPVPVLNVPVRLPTAVGVKVRLMVQETLSQVMKTGAMVAGQLLVAAKSPVVAKLTLN
jgi:hypothetical protein